MLPYATEKQVKKEVEKVKQSCIELPSENNKVYCAQFVTESIVFNDFEPGLYCIRLKNTAYGFVYPDLITQINADTNCVNGQVLLDTSEDEFYILGEYTSDVKTLLIYIQRLSATLSYSNYHIDIFKIG